MQSQSLQNAVNIITSETLPCGAKCLTTDCDGHEGFFRLPKAVLFEGRVYGLSGWNSDKNKAYFRTDKQVAFGI